MKTPVEIISDSEIESAWGNSNFGSTPKRKVIADTLVKIACGHGVGSYAGAICNELGTIRYPGKGNKWALTEKGREYIFSVFNQIEFK